VYINNKVRVASLFRGVEENSPELFESKVKNMFIDVAKEWGVPFEVLNDGQTTANTPLNDSSGSPLQTARCLAGDVTALAASMSLEKNAIIGMAMGTSVAGGAHLELHREFRLNSCAVPTTNGAHIRRLL
jgi:hypothetical protein